jgi:hypothetical protein
MTGSLGPVHIGLAIECLDALAFSATGERAGSPMIAFGYYAVPDLTSASATRRKPGPGGSAWQRRIVDVTMPSASLPAN